MMGRSCWKASAGEGGWSTVEWRPGRVRGRRGGEVSCEWTFHRLRTRRFDELPVAPSECEEVKNRARHAPKREMRRQESEREKRDDKLVHPPA